MKTISIIVAIAMIANFVVWTVIKVDDANKVANVLFLGLLTLVSVVLAADAVITPASASDNHLVWLTSLAMLTDGEGWSVEFLCPNPEASSKDTEWVVVCRGEWTSWTDKRFLGRRHDHAMSEAVRALCAWKDAREKLASNTINA